MAGRKYCRNTVPGTRRGKKYPPKLRAEVVMAMLCSNSICAVARKYGVPESTIRSWVAEEASRNDAFAQERQAAAREIAVRASLGTRVQVAYLQSRAAENQRAAQIREKLNRRLDEDVRARRYEVGVMLKSDSEELADATETGLVIYADPGSFDREMDPEEEKMLREQLERYEAQTMSDRDAANIAKVLMEVAERAAALAPAPAEEEGKGPPLIEIGGEADPGGETEVVLG